MRIAHGIILPYVRVIVILIPANVKILSAKAVGFALMNIIKPIGRKIVPIAGKDFVNMVVKMENV